MQTRAVADVDADEARRAHDEEARLQALSAYAILDTEPELAFDRITSLASRLFRVPIALVSLVDERRQWFKSCIGLDVREASRDVAFCAHAIRQKTPFVVHDARTDARFMDNPWVTGAPRIRFYAGAPLITRSGFCVGTLCILDRSPREMSVDELATLTDLSALVMDELDLRVISQNLEQRSRELADQTSILESVLESAGEASSWPMRRPMSYW